VLRLKRIEEMVELYYNSNQFTHTLPFLLQVFHGPFAMYEALADYYEQKGYFVNSPARVYRYVILLEFALEHDSAQEDVYKELLTYDMYLRENMKSRPEFAKDVSESGIKQKVRAFYQEEAEKRQYLPDYEDYDAKQLGKMTHLESFRFPVWDGEEVLRIRKQNHMYSEEEQGVLFDYKNRNPLTYEAKTFVVSIEE
jgi:hypothetical protein